MDRRMWESEEDPARLMDFVFGRPDHEWHWHPNRGAGISLRKQRLILCACARIAWRHVPSRQSKRIVAAAERYAQGECGEDDLRRIHGLAELPRGPASWAAASTGLVGERFCPGGGAEVMAQLRDFGDRTVGSSDQADVVRDIVPFVPPVWEGEPDPYPAGPPTFLPHFPMKKAWLTADAVSIAARVYAERGSRCPACRGGGIIREPVYRPPVETACPACGDADLSFRIISNEECLWCRRCSNTVRPRFQGHSERECETCLGCGRTPDGLLDGQSLAVLADCLEEAGCPSDLACRPCLGRGYEWRAGDSKMRCPECAGTGRSPHPLLNHLRTPGRHRLGCWAIDTVLGLQ